MAFTSHGSLKVLKDMACGKNATRWLWLLFYFYFSPKNDKKMPGDRKDPLVCHSNYLNERCKDFVWKLLQARRTGYGKVGHLRFESSYVCGSSLL